MAANTNTTNIKIYNDIPYTPAITDSSIPTVIHSTDLTEPFKQSPTANTIDLYIVNNNDSNTNNTDNNRPLLIFIHGGLWLHRDKSQFSNIGQYYSTVYNINTAIINYRLSAPSKSNPYLHPIHTQDVANAILHLTNSNTAAKYGYSSDCPIILSGHSCGAHIIGLLTVNANYYFNTAAESILSRVKCCIGIAGIYDLFEWQKDYPDWDLEIEYSFTADKTKRDSPINYNRAANTDNNTNTANNTANNTTSNNFQYYKPWLIIQSTDDLYVNLRQSNLMAEFIKFNRGTANTANTADTADVQIVPITGGHFESVELIGTDQDQISNTIIKFIQQYIQ